jgi:hypothetical protein
MAITVNRKKRERRTQGVITFDVTGADVGKTYDFMGIAAGFRVVDVNVTVDEAFANANNTIEVGIEDDTDRFVPATAVDAIKGIAFNNKQLTASKTMSIIADIKGTASATGKATITVVYAKLPDSRQEY